MIAADIEPRALLTPKLEIISIDPNYLEDWDDDDLENDDDDEYSSECSSTPSISSSSGFKSHENDSEDLFEEDILRQSGTIMSKGVSIASNNHNCFDKNTINKSQFTKHSETFQSNFYPIDTYANVVNWLDSTPSLPLFSKPIKVKRQRDFPIEVLDNKRIDFGHPMTNHESQRVDSETAIAAASAYKKNPMHGKCNAENIRADDPTNNTENLSPKHADKSSGPTATGNILFEKNQIETTSRSINTSPVKVKRKLNLEEYLKRRPVPKLNPSIVREIKLETNDYSSQTNDKKQEEQGAVNTIQNLYEEIIVVSIGSNTDVTIPIREGLAGDVQSIKLMSKISDTIAKVTNDGGEHIGNNSLIASIRDVIIKKSSSLNCNNSNNTNVAGDDSTNNETEKVLEHGEDKTIMHLKKDRVRYACMSIGVQTDCDIRFPVLDLSKVSNYSKSLSRSPSTSSRSSYSSSYSSDNRKRKCSDLTPRRSIVRNNYSSWSNQGFDKSYKRSRLENDRSEERCTIYVGRIETTTSKDDLKKKFEKYGAIKEISTHQKKNGMKFGFVTFKCAKDAYNTIDCSANDPTINVYDVSFGGRRAFCKESYLDLDNTNVYQQGYMQVGCQNDSFEDLLRKVKLEIESSQKHIK